MSLNNKTGLRQAARESARELRKCQTRAEAIFWQSVRNRRFRNLKFVRQFPILHDLTGRETYYVVDFYCAEYELVIEIDGGIHRKQSDNDKKRERVLKSLGYVVVRFSNAEIEYHLCDSLKRLGEMVDSMST